MISSENLVFGDTHVSQNNPIEMEGYFNILEIMYDDGRHDRKYYLFVDDEQGNPISYQLEFNNSSHSMIDFVSKNVIVKGHMSDSAMQFPGSSSGMKMMADSIEVADFNSLPQPNIPNVEQTTVAGQGIPSPLKSYMILTKFADVPTEHHTLSYFDNLFYNATSGVYSLRNFWFDASYGLLDIQKAGITNWVSVPKNSNQYFFTNPSIFEFTNAALTAAEAIGAIDYNGADDIIQNNSPSNLKSSGNNGDDIDQLIFIFNKDSFYGGGFPCGCAFAYTGPVPLNTSQGTMYFYLGYNLDEGDTFSVGTSYLGGIGVPSHEMGHNLNWSHTPTHPPHSGTPYDDPWSLLSKIADSTSENPAGPIAYQRDHAKWIPTADIITVPDGQSSTFTLDMLSDPSPGPNYLMAKIPFGMNEHFYTLEARVDAQFDNTPDNKMGLVIYHISPTGHPSTAETTANASIVDVNGAVTIADWKNADLALGDSYVANNIVITHLSQTATTITVKVDNNIPCSPPDSGDWTVTTHCTLTSNGIITNGDLIVTGNSTLTIPSGIILDIDFSSHNLTVESGSGVLIKSGGKIT